MKRIFSVVLLVAVCMFLTAGIPPCRNGGGGGGSSAFLEEVLHSPTVTYPNLANSIRAYRSASNYTLGTPVTLIPASTFSKPYIIKSLSMYNPYKGGEYFVQVAIGGTVKGQFVFESASSGYYNKIDLRLFSCPVIQASDVVTVALGHSTGNASFYADFSANVIELDNTPGDTKLERHFTAVQKAYPWLATTKTHTIPASIWTWSTPTDIVPASTITNQFDVLALVFDQTGTWSPDAILKLDDGSTEIVRARSFHSDSSYHMVPMVYPMQTDHVTANSAVRFSGAHFHASTGTFNMWLYYHEHE